MIVKAVGLPEITTGKLLNEQFGNLIARELGIHTPAPAVVEIGPEFVATSAPYLPRHQSQLQPGLSVGTEKLDGLMPLPYGEALSKDELAQATLIYACDLLIQNPDRLIKNPNCGKHRDRLVAYDFEMAFTFVPSGTERGNVSRLAALHSDTRKTL